MARYVRTIILEERDISEAEIASLIRDERPQVPALPAPAPKPDDKPRFEACVSAIFGHEGGYSDHPRDNGGATNMGITIGALSDWLGRPATKDEVRLLSREVAKRIYYEKYWLPSECDALPAGIDLMLFNIAVNAGVWRGQVLFQEVLSAEGVYSGRIDGDIGPKTASALAKLDYREFITRYAQRIEVFYRGLDDFDVFGNGWLSRLKKIHDKSQVMVQTQVHPLAIMAMNDPTISQPIESENSPMTMIDLLIGGELLKGRKTIVGILLWVAVSLEYGFNFIPDAVLGPDLMQMIWTFSIGLAGLGAVSKIERFMRIFVPNMPDLSGYNARDDPAKVKPAPNTFDPFSGK